jgi:3-oxoacyl-[acyl-carrier protein] reductase
LSLINHGGVMDPGSNAHSHAEINKPKDYMLEMKDLVVIITGAGQGIGKSIALEFARKGSRVVVCSRTKSDIDTVKSEIKCFGGNCLGLVVDVSIKDQVDAMVNKVISEYNRVDVLINCAGIYGPICPFESTDMTEWKKTIDINLIGTVFCTHSVLPVMKKQKKGKIINFCGGSVGSVNLNPNFSAYVTSKFAVAGFTEVIANELMAYNIQVNAISPGAVNTRFIDQVLAAGELAGAEFLKKSKEQKQEGGTSPMKAAMLAIYLASSASDFVSGKTLSAV